MQGPAAPATLTGVPGANILTCGSQVTAVLLIQLLIQGGEAYITKMEI